MLENLLEESTILERVDSYSIYAYYIEFEPELGKAYNSPIRKDDEVPSFSLFEYNNKIFFKDHALGESGTVFKFIKLLYSYKTLLEVYSKINIDFELDLIGGIKLPKNNKKATIVNSFKRNSFIGIKINSKKQNSQKYIDFWKLLDIQKLVLEMYHVTEPDTIVMQYIERQKPFYPRELTIAYRIKYKYQIYFPFKLKGKKFINNYPEGYVLGYEQLTYKNNFLIITKANKEIIFFRQHFDWDTISGKSETTLVPKNIMIEMLQKFKTIFIWLDNDVAGQKAQNKYLELYPFLIPIYHEVKQKDPTDFYVQALNKQKALNEIKILISERC